MQDLFVNYSDMISIICIPLIISILAFVYPLIIQAVERIDSKYSSSVLVQIFWNDNKCIFFKCVLKIALAVVVFFAFAHFCHLPETCAFIAELLLLSISALLILSTLCIIRLVPVYYMPEPLTNIVFKQYRQSLKSFRRKEKFHAWFTALKCKLLHVDHIDPAPNSEPSSEKYLLYAQALADIIRYYILNTNDSADKFAKIYIGLFDDDVKSSATNDYPPLFYTILIDIHRTLCNSTEKDLSPSCSHAMVLYDILLISSGGKIHLSEKSYRTIWTMLMQAATYERWDIIKQYWKRAEQDILGIQKFAHIKRYQEFHDSLCAFVLHAGQYDLFTYMLYYTYQTPPSYNLMPEYLTDVISRFMQVEQNSWGQSYFYYQNNYPFLHLEDVDAVEKIKKCIKRYYAFLFLRQYTLPFQFIYLDRLELPNVSDLSQREKAHWLEQLPEFQEYVNALLKDSSSLQLLEGGHDFTAATFVHKVQTPPDELFRELQKQLEYSIQQTKKTQSIDPAFRTQFDNYANSVLSSVFTAYKPLFSGKLVDDHYTKLFYHGSYQFLPKGAFSNDAVESIDGAIEMPTDTVAAELSRDLLNILMVQSTYEYTLHPIDVFTAIDNLHLSKDEFCIISIGNNISNFAIYTDGLQYRKGFLSYKGIPIINIPYTANQLMCFMFLIMRRDELPTIIFHDQPELRIQNYDLKNINTRFNIYTTLIDLYITQNQDLLREASKQIENDQIDFFVAAAVDVNIETRISHSSRSIRLNLWDHSSKSVPQTVHDVKNIWEAKA